MAAPYKHIVTIDFETRWSKTDYTLSKMTTEEYIRDPRFKAFGACLHEFGSELPPRWHNGDDLHDALTQFDWSETAILAHNAQFDVSILEWKYDCHPCFILDTLSMARALRGIEAGNSLATLAQEFNLPPKGNAVHNTDGLEELTPEIEAELAEYCAHDVMLCEEIFFRLSQGYPSKELRLIDMTLRMYTQPRLILDGIMLTKAIEEEREQREALLTNLGITDADLASNPKFASLLEAVGVPAPKKISKTTGEETLALAKNDALFQAIMNGDNAEAVLLCEARLKVKSTTERTRAQRFLDISKRGALPVPLSYYGASTGRWTASRGSAINMQNLKRGSFLRKAILAPRGQTIVVGDLSQIEPRVLAWLADYEDMLDIFRSGADPYAAFGAQMFNIPGMTKESHPELRQSAKSALLGCGYGLGWASFASQLMVGFLGAPPIRYDKAFAQKLGVNRSYVERFLSRKENEERLLEIPHICSDDELAIHSVAAKKIIDTYRTTAYPVVGLWALCTKLMVDCLVEGDEFQYKCLTFRKGEIELPNKMKIRYPDLRLDAEKNWVYGKDATKLYAGKITNNITQALARIVMTDGMLRVSKRYPVVGTVHDELIALAPEDEAQEALDWVLEQMTMEPSYMPGIPLAADGGTNLRYGDAKQ
jgi:DNA polymerase family A